jgi:hypothetical protein
MEQKDVLRRRGEASISMRIERTRHQVLKGVRANLTYDLDAPEAIPFTLDECGQVVTHQ